jgi:uncharacterized membrane protein
MVAFVGFHFVLSSLPVRRKLIERLGEGRFTGVYSLLVAVALVAILVSWVYAPYLPVWEAPGWTRWIPNVVMPFAILLALAGFTTPSATTPGLATLPPPTGMLRVTRHPSLWGFTLWAASHTIPNGDLRSLVVFSGIFVLAVGGMLHIDARRAATQGDAWRDYLRQTSILPFGAILAGRQTFSLREIRAWRFAVAILVWIAILHVHRLVLGVSPFP